MELLILCIKIFFVRIIDVSLGTLRTMFMVKGKKFIAAIIGLVEVLIWFLIVREALTFETSSIFVAISYSSGFATGTLIGGFMAQKLIAGNITLQVFTSSNELIKAIREAGYGLTALNYKGIDEAKEKNLIYITVDKKQEKEVRKIINRLDSNAFIVVNETTYVQNGYFK